MKKLISTILFCVVAVSATAQNLSITYVAKNAVRVRYETCRYYCRGGRSYLDGER